MKSWKRGKRGRKMRRVNVEGLRSQDRKEAAYRIQIIGRTLCPDDKVAIQVRCAAEALGWDTPRARRIWYGEARRIEAWEFQAILHWTPPSNG
jgi:hypothetical protein